jgi:maltooligosyltrehalose synthase
MARPDTISLNNLNGIFIDPRGEKPLSDFYAEFTGDTLDYPAVKCDQEANGHSRPVGSGSNRR